MPNPMKLALAIALIASSNTIGANELLPSEFTVLVNHALQAQPGIERRSVTDRFIGRVKTENLSEIERFFRGEVFFLTLDPERSRDDYWEFRARDDDLGRVAWQRMMTIRINAFQMVDEFLEQDIPCYNTRFGIRADDRYGISFPIQRAAQLMAGDGRTDRALDLVADHVREHDRFDAPYTAYALPGQFLSLAEGNGRAEEFRALNEWVLQGLDTAIKARMENLPNEGPRASGVPGEVFSSLFADRNLDSFEWTAEYVKLRQKISDGMATARGRPDR